MGDINFELWIDNEITGPEMLDNFPTEKEAENAKDYIRAWDVYTIFVSKSKK